MPGALVSVEGINGVGKDFLLQRLRTAHPELEASVVAEFSKRRDDDVETLDRHILRTLAADGDRYLRGGRPRTETMLLLAIKLHDYEQARPVLHAGQCVIEGRGLHTVAVYQSVLLCSDDQAAYAQALAILELATRWRPLADRTVLVADDPATAARRLAARDGNPLRADERRINDRAAALYGQLAAHPDYGMTVLDRRETDTDDAVDVLHTVLTSARSEVTSAQQPETSMLRGSRSPDPRSA